MAQENLRKVIIALIVVQSANQRCRGGRMNEQWKELYETIIEMRDNDGTGTQQEVCGFLANLMGVLEKQMDDSEKPNKWIPCSERLPNNHEYIKNKGLFCVSDGNRSYFEWFDIYNTERFVEPTIAGFRVDNAVIAWMPLPLPYKQEAEG